MKYDDGESEERTLAAMDFNIACKQKLIDKLIADNISQAETIRGLMEEITTLEYLQSKGGRG